MAVAAEAGDRRLADVMIPVSGTLLDALRAIDRGYAGMTLITTDHGVLFGVLTDGDVRRALLSGADLSDPITAYVRRNPVVVGDNVHRARVVDLMRARRIGQIPIVDQDGRVIGLHLLTDAIGPKARTNAAVIMAGGRGKRLGKLTDNLPKPMIPVAGRPILEWIILHLVSEGIRDVVLSVGYKAESIIDHFQQGERFGCRIRYVHDEPGRPRGSGGALASVPREWLNEQPLIVMNADLLAQFDLDQLLRRHSEAGASLTMAVRTVSHQVAFGVVHTDADDMAIALHEKPQLSWQVNAGIYVVDPGLLGIIPESGEYPLTNLIETCLDIGERVATWPLVDEWTDIGQPADLAKARGQF